MMRKIGILLMGSILLGGASLAQADKWHGNKHKSGYQASKGQQASVYGTHHNNKSKAGHRIKYGSRHWKKEQSNKRRKAHIAAKHKKQKVVYVKPTKVIHVAPKKVVYVRPKHKHQHYKVPRHKYVYVKPVYAPRYYGYHSYRGYYWPFLNMRFVVNLTLRQMEHHHQALYSALDAPAGYEATWRDSGRKGSIVVLREGYDSNGNLCKRYRQTLTYHGHMTSSVEESCLSSDGYWISV